MSFTRLSPRQAHHYVAWETTNQISERTGKRNSRSWSLKILNGTISKSLLHEQISPKFKNVAIATVGAQSSAQWNFKAILN